MKIELNGKELKEALKVIKTKYITIAADQDSVTIAGQDELKDGGYHSIQKTFKEAEIFETGSMTVNADSLKLVKNEYIIIENDKIIGAKRTIKAAVNNELDFNYKALDNKITTVNSNDYTKLKACLYATAKDETRPILQNILMDSENFVALDGYRMTIKKHEVKELQQDIIINYELFTLIKAIKKVETLDIYTNNNIMEYVINNEYRITLSKVEGKYVNYKSITPDVCEMRKILINRDDLLSVLKEYKEVKSNGNNLVVFNVNNNNLETIAKNETVKISDNFEVENSTKLELTIGFNRLYLIDALNQVEKGSKVEIYLISKVSAGIIKAANSNDINLVLPVRIIR